MKSKIREHFNVNVFNVSKKLILCAALLAGSLTTYAQVGVNTVTPQGALDVVSTSSGIVVPRVANLTSVTNPQGGAIVDGTIVYNEDENCFKGYADGAWVDLSTCTEPIVLNAMTFDSVNAYNGISVINSQGIGYNGEALPAASTIDVDVVVTEATAYSFTATDSTTGISYTATGSFPAAGTYTVTLQNNGVTIGALVAGTISMTLTGASNTLALAPRIDIKSIPASSTAVVPVTLSNGQVWMDRNLGARRAATASNDGLGYGNLYQWGRGSDGHEIIVTNGADPTVSVALNTTTTSTLATTVTPGNSNFIVNNTAPADWVNPQNETLWQGTAGTNNPCPTGYRLPTQDESNTMASALSITNTATAASSSLAWSALGFRLNTNGTISNEGDRAFYWTSTTGAVTGGTHSRARNFTTASTGIGFNPRSFGFAVRCIRN